MPWVDKIMNLQECKDKCLQNCSCMAYSVFDISGGSGCAIWFGDLIDIKQFQDGGQDLYIRMNASEVGMSSLLILLVLEHLNIYCFDVALFLLVFDYN